ncbi:MAG TPA: type IV toxin-antitoxin system AbiEi family antitoxin domain-containing protein [Thermoleophilaceae bacterium]|nr:type IV toxin-antitoxin system AbiEi family antitoxin domain-containing protein [Thermoleophilaceae bacterium]
MAPKVRPAEQIAAGLASRAHGIVTRSELIEAGLSAEEVRHRLRIGALIRQHRGVYRVGHRAPSVEALYMAAVKACGEGALRADPPRHFCTGS